MRSKFMNDVPSSIHRQFAQEEFEKSLQTLKHLSATTDQEIEEDEDDVDLSLCWDEVADDLELFFSSVNSPDIVVASESQDSEEPKESAGKKNMDNDTKSIN